MSIEEFDAKIDAKTSKTANSSIDDIDEDFYGSESYNADEFDAEGFDEMNFNEIVGLSNRTIRITVKSNSIPQATAPAGAVHN